MAGAGVGDEHVEPLERPEDALDRGRVGDVELDAGAADRGCDPLRRGAVEVGHDDVVPRLGEPLGVGAPEAVGAARDQRDRAARSSDDPERPRDEPLEPERGPCERVARVVAELAVDERERLGRGREPEDVDGAEDRWQPALVGAGQLEQLLVPERLGAGGDLAVRPARAAKSSSVVERASSGRYVRSFTASFPGSPSCRTRRSESSRRKRDLSISECSSATTARW